MLFDKHDKFFAPARYPPNNQSPVLVNSRCEISSDSAVVWQASDRLHACTSLFICNESFYFCNPLHYTPLHYIPLHYTPLHHVPLHYIPLHYILLFSHVGRCGYQIAMKFRCSRRISWESLSLKERLLIRGFTTAYKTQQTSHQAVSLILTILARIRRFTVFPDLMIVICSRSLPVTASLIRYWDYRYPAEEGGERGVRIVTTITSVTFLERDCKFLLCLSSIMPRSIAE